MGRRGHKSMVGSTPSQEVKHRENNDWLVTYSLSKNYRLSSMFDFGLLDFGCPLDKNHQKPGTLF